MTGRHGWIREPAPTNESLSRSLPLRREGRLFRLLQSLPSGVTICIRTRRGTPRFGQILRIAGSASGIGVNSSAFPPLFHPIRLRTCFILSSSIPLGQSREVLRIAPEPCEHETAKTGVWAATVAQSGGDDAHRGGCFVGHRQLGDRGHSQWIHLLHDIRTEGGPFSGRQRESDGAS